MKRLILNLLQAVAFAVPLACSSLCVSQDRPPEPGQDAQTPMSAPGILDLDLDSVTPTDLQVQETFWIPIHCDSNDSLYLRSVEGQTAFESRLYQIRKDGRLGTTINLADTAELKKPLLLDFAVTDIRDVLTLIQVPKQGPFVARFSQDGQFRSKFPLDRDADFYRISTLPEGNILTLGFYRQDSVGGHKKGDTIANVYDSHGVVIRNLVAVLITPSVETNVGDAGEDSAKKSKSPNEPLQLNRGIVNGGILTGQDGRVYIFYNDSRPRLVKIGDDLQMTDSILLAPHPGGQIDDLKISKDQVLADVTVLDQESNKRERFFYIYSIQSGSEIARYRPSAAVTGILACFGDREITFLARDKSDRRVLLRATIK